MTTRIRYKTEGTKLISKSIFNTNDTGVRVVLDTETLKFTIVDVLTNEVLLTGGNTTNLAVLKIQVKNVLKDLGVEFNTETRKTVSGSKVILSSVAAHASTSI